MRRKNWYNLFYDTAQYWRADSLCSPTHIGYFTHHLWFIVGVNGVWYKPHETVQGFMLLVINKEEDEYFKLTALSFILL